MKQLISSLFLMYASSCFAVIPNSLFSDHMVLQQKVDIPVWGIGRNGEEVRVEFNDHEVSTTVEDNYWSVAFPPMQAGGPYTMRITGDTTMLIEDIYIGEVWVCGGQSNMGRTMSPHWKYQTITNFKKERKHAEHPQIRQYVVPETKSDTAVEDAHGSWTVCAPSTVESFSAVGYFFARDLQESVHVPVGIILAAVGGTQATYWTSRAALSSNSKLLPLVQAYDSAIRHYPANLARYNSQKDSLFAGYKTAKELAAREHKPIPKKPEPPHDPRKRWRVSCFYNGMIAPLTKYPIRGVTWYQGESDRDFPMRYRELFPSLIADWRKNWDIGIFPFLFVQIAPFKENNPEIREAQLLTLKKTSNTSMVVTTDCGDAKDIHPPFKQPIGYRLSLAARALAYGESVPYSGPIYKSFDIREDRFEIFFDHIYNGLNHKGDYLSGFTISENGIDFLPASATIDGEKVIVFHESVANPIAVRYGWSTVPAGNLYNSAGLPTSPFRTDANNSKPDPNR